MAPIACPSLLQASSSTAPAVCRDTGSRQNQLSVSTEPAALLRCWQGFYQRVLVYAVVCSS